MWPRLHFCTNLWESRSRQRVVCPAFLHQIPNVVRRLGRPLGPFHFVAYFADDLDRKHDGQQRHKDCDRKVTNRHLVETFKWPFSFGNNLVADHRKTVYICRGLEGLSVKEFRRHKPECPFHSAGRARCAVDMLTDFGESKVRNFRNVAPILEADLISEMMKWKRVVDSHR